MIGVFGAIGWHIIAKPESESMDMVINGSGYDLALAFASLQVQTRFASSLSNGKTSELLKMDLDERGLENCFLTIPDMPFTGSVALYEYNKERVMRAHPAFDIIYPLSFLQSVVENCTLLICELGFRKETLQSLNMLANDRGVPILWIARSNSDWQKIEDHPEWQCHNLFASPHAYEQWISHIHKMPLLKETGFAAINSQGNMLMIWQNNTYSVLPISTSTQTPEYRFSNIVAAVVNEMTSWSVPLIEACRNCSSTFETWTDLENTGGADLERKVASFYKKVENLEHDALTGLLSRGAAEKLLAGKTLSAPLSMIIIDVDHFKRINDTLGHHIGDDVLRRVAGKINRETRDKDVAVRWGGEEFVVLCPNCPEERASAIANRIRLSIMNVDTEIGNMSASFGVAQRKDHEMIEDWFIRVDSRLYYAKRTGRNRVCAQDPSDGIEELQKQ